MAAANSLKNGNSHPVILQNIDHFLYCDFF